MREGRKEKESLLPHGQRVPVEDDSLLVLPLKKECDRGKTPALQWIDQ